MYLLPSTISGRASKVSPHPEPFIFKNLLVLVEYLNR